jgi:arsenate reductase-like glutaredoxin family protein
VIELLLDHPELMQGPVVIRGKRAVIARPSERVEALL